MIHFYDGNTKDVPEIRRLMDRSLRNLDQLLAGTQPFETLGTLHEGLDVASIQASLQNRAPDLIIIGSHGHGAMYNAFVGSIGRLLIGCAETVVLVVPSRGIRTRQQINRVAVAVDFGSNTDRLMYWATHLAQQLKASLHVIHIRRPPKTWKEDPSLGMSADELVDLAQAIIQEKMEQLKKQLPEPMRSDLKMEGKLGITEQDLLRSCDQAESDLIVMGSHGHGRACDLIIGSVAQKVIQHSNLPVLLIPLNRDGSTTNSETEPLPTHPDTGLLHEFEL